jgi:hypothetical protein
MPAAREDNRILEDHLVYPDQCQDDTALVWSGIWKKLARLDIYRIFTINDLRSWWK